MQTGEGEGEEAHANQTRSANFSLAFKCVRVNVFVYGVSHNIINLARSSFRIHTQTRKHTHTRRAQREKERENDLCVFVPVYLSILFSAVITHGKYEFLLSVAIYICVHVSKFLGDSFSFLSDF